MEVADHHPRAALIVGQKSEKDAYRARKLQIILLAIQGWTAPAITMAVKVSRRVVQRHVAADNRDGLPGLDDQRGAPSQPVLNANEQVAFGQRRERGPQPFTRC